MLRRVLATVLVLTLLPAGLSGCQRKVSVQTGERITCRFGDVIKDTVHTVKVPASQAGLYSVKTSFSVCPRHQAVMSLYDKAQKDISANKSSSAKQLLSRVIAQDPNFGQAAAQLAALKAGKKANPDLVTTRQGTGGTAGGTSSGSGSTGGSSGGTNTGGGTEAARRSARRADPHARRVGARVAHRLQDRRHRSRRARAHPRVPPAARGATRSRPW